MLDLGPGQVDIKRRLIKLNPDGRKQTKRYRPVVPISETLLPWLEQSGGPRYVLYHGKPVASVKKSLAKAVAAAGLKDVSPYCLRHIMATELRTRGFPSGKRWECLDTRARHEPRSAMPSFPGLPRRSRASNRYVLHRSECRLSCPLRSYFQPRAC